jgi:CubicO group peptidase (beta-lactamase class C family)
LTERDLVALLRDQASRHSVPGAAIGVLRDGAVTAAHWGVANASTGEAVTADTRFAVGSLGKSMVATAVARLVGAGRLSLDDPAAAYVPELRGTRWAEGITLRELLANRSRIPLRADLEFSGLEGEEDDVLSRFAAEVVRGEPTAQSWSYTNAGWCLLGRAIETLTGLTWESAMQANLLVPLERAHAPQIAALPIDGRAFLVDLGDPDTPTVTFGAFDDNGRPGSLYQMLWGFPRV